MLKPFLGIGFILRGESVHLSSFNSIPESSGDEQKDKL